jgi:hypothetical protein
MPFEDDADCVEEDECVCENSSIQRSLILEQLKTTIYVVYDDAKTWTSNN